MIIPDKKKVASIILAKMKPDGSESMSEMKPEASMGGENPELMAIAEDMIMAVKSGSTQGLVEALEALLEHVR